MIRAEGIPFDDQTTAIDNFEAKFLAVAMRVMSEVAAELGVVTVAAAEPTQSVSSTSPAGAAGVGQVSGEASVSLDTLGLIATLWAGAVVAELGPDVIAAFLAGGAAVGAALPEALVSSSVLELHTALAEQFLAAANNRMVRFSDQLWEIARAQLLEGFIEGESIAQLRDRLRNVSGLAAGRASNVARTEIISASNAGSLAMAQLSGMAGSKEWLATNDARTRETHVAADGDKVALDGVFIVGGFPLAFPGDPAGPPEEICQCRCTIVYHLHDGSLTAAGAEMAQEWMGVLAVEGSPTGDQRTFMPGALTWADPPLPLRWQIFDEEGHEGAAIVGNITQITRTGNLLVGRGTFDMGGAYGVEAYRMVDTGYLSGVSIDADDISAADVEVIYGPGVTPEDGPAVSMVIYHGGRIRGATLCAIPAFVEAKIACVPDEMTAPEPTMDGMMSPMAQQYSEDALVAAAVPPHNTATSDRPWDKGPNLKNLPSPMPLAKAKAAFAWYDSAAVDGGKIAKDACKFPHHEVSSDGTVGAANLDACSAGIGALHGARGGASIPDADRRGVYNHLARHLKDGGQTPPPFQASAQTVTASSGTNVTVTEVEPLTAAAYVLTIPDVPDPSWFEQPSDDMLQGAWTVTDQGRVYGLLAPAGVAHRSFSERVTVPMGNVDYSLFMGRETVTASGERIVTGAITMDCGHASTGFRDPAMALEHYDNSCSIVATVRIGESRKGVWVAGALIPGLSATQLSKLMACQLSGDWRPHRERSGWREFAGALLVPVPGFAMARSQASVRMEDGALVSSAVPVQYAATNEDEGCGCPSGSAESPSFASVIGLIERSVGLDPATQIAQLSAIVNP